MLLLLIFSVTLNKAQHMWIPSALCRFPWMGQMLTGDSTLVWSKNAKHRNSQSFRTLEVMDFILFMVAFKKERWKLENLLRSLWQLFHDSPARREDFVTITENRLFPLRFCPHRWEDIKVAERAFQIWPDVKKFVSSFKDPKKAPKTVSFSTVKAACDDPFTTPKLEFFVSVAKQLYAFLTKFQTDTPMAPFLGYYLQNLLIGLMNRFIKKEVMDKADTYQKLASIDPQDKKNHMVSKKVDIGFAARHSLKRITEKKAASELQVLAFINECITMLAALTAKLNERNPLKYPLVRYLSCLRPEKLVTTESGASSNFDKILQILLNGKWCSGDDCNELLSMYKSFSI